MTTDVRDTPAGPLRDSRDGSPAAGARPRSSASANGATAPAISTAIVLATASAEGGRPAAALRWEEESTVLGRLLAQLAGLGVSEACIVTRPGWETDLRAALDGIDLDASLRASSDPAEDLRAVAELAHAGEGGLVVAHGEIVAHREALAGLLADPRLATGILTTQGRLGYPFGFRLRPERGRVVSAASPYHSVHRPKTRSLGVLKVAAADRPALAVAAERMAELAAPPLPDGWSEELERKAGTWRLSLARAAARAEGAEADADAPELQAHRPGEGADGADPRDVALEPQDEEELRRRLEAAPADVPALLLVGLVRAGVQVGNSYLRSLFWARPLSQAGIERAQREITEYDEDRVLLDSAVKGSDGFFTTFFVSPYSKYIARWAARRGLSPNTVTTVSLLIGVLAAAAFATGERVGLVAGAVLLQLAFTTDCVDGQLARYTRTFSKLGAWLDSVFDRTKEYVVFAGLAIGASAMGDDVWLLAGAALTLQTVRHMIDFSYGAAQHQGIAATPQPPLEQTADVAGAAAAARAAAQEADAAPATTDAAPAAPEPAPPRPSARDLPRRALGLWRMLDRLPGVGWLKRIVAFPIGERFAVISLTAALTTPHTTFVVVLAWGGLALAYTLTGRLLRTALAR